ncbi:SDR family oxidoreductase [Companilactobacillus heilongjiangensis]|uniref:NmrA family transcriptional regulator n=1 Tax=Companilactobacillus heilongjiangensis TaxID=1074467 RepID=A0A0K2LEQ8_9LACO|nr:SDR family oxidoreductase [Companilactobacillus heilongjiangensis]ALB29791.1 NmrA family transcriptional regulator [Companilactobacillus heilongjiangensis]
MADKILVIGGTGNIGYPLIKYLNQQDVQIVAGTHNIQKAQAKFEGLSNVEIKHFDFLDPSTFEAAFDGVNKVFFVRPPQLAKPKQDMLPFLTFAKQKQIQQIVFVSLIGVEKNPMTPHHKIEQMILDLKIPYTFIRPSFFMQNLNTTHREDIQKNHDLFIPAGNARTSFIDTRDIGEVAGITLMNDKYLNQKLNITGPAALSYQEIAKIMTKVLGTPITYSKPSLLKFRKVMLKRGIKKDFVNVMVMLYLITQLGNAKEVTDTAAKVLGHTPRTIQNYIYDYQDYFK